MASVIITFTGLGGFNQYHLFEGTYEECMEVYEQELDCLRNFEGELMLRDWPTHNSKEALWERHRLVLKNW